MVRASEESVVESLLSDSRSYWVPSPVCELSRIPTSLEFLRDYVSQSVPFVVRGGAAHWDATRRWSAAYLAATYGDTNLTVSLTPDGYADAVTKTGRFAQPMYATWTLKKLLDGLWLSGKDKHNANGSTGRDVVPYYSLQNSCFTGEAKALCSEVDFGSIGFARDAFGVAETASNLWIGDSRSVTTCHADPFHNLYAVTTGKKIFQMRPPSDAAVLRRPSWPNARWHRDSDSDCDDWKLEDDADGNETKWISHHESDGYPYPGEELVVELEAGDLLYMPPLWFHTVLQEGLTVAVNWWFDMTYGRDWVLKELFDKLCRNKGFEKEGKISKEAT